MITNLLNKDIIIEELEEEKQPFLLNEKVEIEFTPVWCTITSNNKPELHEYLYENLSYRPEGYFFSPKYQEGVWDGYNRLYKGNTKRFRAGLLTRVTELLEEARCKVKVRDFPKRNGIELKKKIYKNAKNEDIESRVYQREAARSALYYRYGIIQAPPRAGKSLISVIVIDNEEQFPVNFFVRSKDLAYQTLEVFKNNFLDKSIGFICDGICEIGDINIITIQSAYSAYNKKYKEKGLAPEKEVVNKLAVKKLIRDTKVVFYDEVHHSSSKTSKFLLDKATNSDMKIGLSATPFSDKADSILVEEAIGSVIYQISYSELIKQGYLMKPYIYMYKLPKMDIEGTYRAIYKKAVIENEFLNDLLNGLIEKLISKNKSVVIQTEFVKHSKDLAKRFNCEYLTGSDPTEKRKEVIEALKNKEILCLVSTLFEEGLDLPSLDYTVNLAGGLSNISTFQRMRSITAHESKTSVGIIDFIHQCKYLKKHSKKRLNLYSSEPEFIVEIRDVSKKSIQEIFS